MTSSDLLPKNEDVVLACAFIPDANKRTEVLVLYAFLETLRDIPERTTEPLMGEIRLRWWYEAIEEIRAGKPVRYHPLTEALKALIGKYGFDPQAFLDMIEGQMPLLDKGALTVKDALGVADSGEGCVAALAATILGDFGDLVATSRFYGMAQLKARRGLSDAGDTELAHLSREAAETTKALPSGLLPVALPTALAPGVWSGRPAGPLTKRLKLFWAYLTGRI
ncbi:MAG: squalene/phytoene synthase family protein [Asticcacaulis sp.]